MTKTFTKVTENFECKKCGQEVQGSGYTNHCPNCLYSLHVDNYPGDRASTCCGLMKPSVEKVSGSNYTLKHTCIKCGHSKVNKSAKDDNVQEIIKLSTKK